MRISEFAVDRFGPGSKQSLYVDLLQLPAGEVARFPVVVVRGKTDGKKLLVCAGIHGDEYEGMEAIRNVFSRLDPNGMRGTFVGVPIVNLMACTAGERVNRFDHQDLARVFPGGPAGTLTEQIAYHLAETFIKGMDFFCDLHSAGSRYKLHPWAGYIVNEEPMLTVQREAAIAFGLDCVWAGPWLPGRSLSAAQDKGVPSIYAEMTGAGQCRLTDVENYGNGVMNLMRFLGMVDGDYPTTPPKYFCEEPDADALHLQQHHKVQHAGFLRTRVELWQFVKEGEPVGEVVDPLGRVLQEIRAERTGRIAFLRVVPRVLPGDPACASFPCEDGG